MQIKKNDTVMVTAGKEKGKRGRVIAVYPRENRILIEKLNMIKRHTRPNPQRNIKGGIAEREAPIHVSNVMIVSPDDDKKTRIGSKVLPDGKRVRIGRRGGEVLDK